MRVTFLSLKQTKVLIQVYATTSKKKSRLLRPEGSAPYLDQDPETLSLLPLKPRCGKPSVLRQRAGLPLSFPLN